MNSSASGSRESRVHRGLTWLGVPAGITILSVCAELGGEAARAQLRYEHAGVVGGELWRLVTGHLVHLGPAHLALNLAGLGAIVILAGGIRPGNVWWAWAALGSAAAIDLGLLVVRPGLDWYVGLSGVLHGLWAAVGLRTAFAGERAQAIGLIVLLSVKLAIEQVFGPGAMSVAIAGGPVVVDAHLFGAAGGAFAACLIGAARARP